MPSVAFVINRTLLRDRQGFLARCRAAAADRGWDPWFAETSEVDAGQLVTRRALADGVSLVFAAGGDGTVRACADALADTGVPLAIVPLGTANLTARALGVPSRAGRAVDAGFGGRDHRIDLASLREVRTDEAAASGTSRQGSAWPPQRPRGGSGGHTVHSPGRAGGGADRAEAAAGRAEGGAGGTEGGEVRFVAMAGIGLDAAVVEAARVAAKRRLGWAAYALAGLAHLSLPPRDFTIRLDGQPPLRRRARCVVVANAGLLPGGFALLPRARLDDGLLDVGILAPAGPLGWALVAGRVLARGRRQDRQLERFQARRVRIGAAVELPRQVDGEVIAPGRTLDVSVCPGTLTVRLPGLGEGAGGRAGGTRSVQMSSCRCVCRILPALLGAGLVAAGTGEGYVIFAAVSMPAARSLPAFCSSRAA